MKSSGILRSIARLCAPLFFVGAVHAQLLNLPSIVVASPAAGSTVNAGTGIPYLITGLAPLGFVSPLVNCTVGVYDSSHNLVAQPTFTLNGLLSSIVASGTWNLPPGTYSLVANITDILGNVANLGGTPTSPTYRFKVIAATSTVNPVTFNPPTKIASGNEPFTLSTVVTTTPLVTTPGYTLTVNGPTDSNAGDYPMNVSYQISLLVGPDMSQIGTATALTYVRIYSQDSSGNFTVGSPSVGANGPTAPLVFTGPGQSKSLYITEVIPAGVFAGNYLYQIAGTWISNGSIISSGAGTGSAPSGATIQEQGATGGAGEPTINSTITTPVQTNNSPPTVKIITPPDQQSYYISSSPGSTFPSFATINPIIAEGDIPLNANPVSGINLTWGNTSLALTNTTYVANAIYSGYDAGTGQVLTQTSQATLGDAVAASAAPNITVPGTYLINAQAFNASGSSPFATVAVNVISVPAPGIAISPPATGSTLVIPVGATTVAGPYLLTGAVSVDSDNMTWNIDTAVASLTDSTGATVAGFSPDFSAWPDSSSLNPTAGGTLPALGVGTYTIKATVLNDGGVNTGTSTFAVAQAAAPSVAVTGLSSAYTIPSGSTTISPTFAFTGATAGGTADTILTSAAVTLNGVAVTPSTLTGVGTAAAISGNGILANLGPGAYTIVVSDSNGAPMAGGGIATASQSFTFTIVQAATPAISITAPAGSSSVTIPAGSTSIGVPYAITGGTSGGTVNNSIISATATLTPSNGGSVVGGFTGSFGGLNSASVSDSGTATLTAGTYTLAATDSNGVANASGSVTFTVVQAATPTIAITAPGNGSTITIPAGSATAAVPYAITGGTSGGTANNTITTASATLTSSGGSTWPGFTGAFTGLNSASATDSGTATLPAGTYTLAATDSNGVAGPGGSASQSITFTVAQAATPSISITAPANGATITVPSGQTTVAVPYAIAGSTNGTASTIDNTIISASASLTPSNGGTVGAGFTGSFTGLNSANATDSGTVTLSPGTYTLTANDSNGAPGTTGSASQTITFTVAGPVLPTIAINPPGNGATYPVGSGGTASVPYVITGTTPSGTNFPNSSSGTATLTASAGGSVSGVVQPAFTGFGSSSTTITASGTFTLTPGTYTLAASDTNSTGGKATATPVTFTVTASCSAPTVTTSSNFCVSKVYGGNYIWFNSIMDVTGIGTSAGTLQLSNPTITFTANGAPVSLAAPNATVTFSATATSATTTYDAPSNTWLTTVPVGYVGSIFLTGVAYPVNNTISVGSGAVTWSGSFLGSAQGATGLWQIGATVYSPFTSSLNNLGVKPVDSRSLSQYHTSDPAGTPENYTACNNGDCCSSTGSSGGSTAIAGLYSTGVNSTGGLLAGGSTDSHWVVTASTLGSAYLGNAYVDPTPLAGGWVANSSTAQWVTAPGGANIGNGGGNNGLPSSGSTAQTSTYDYTLTFSLPAGANVSATSITGTLSADDSVLVYVNGSRVTSGVPNATDYEYNTTASFTLNSSNASFQAGSNTITFRVANENSPTPKNASGLYVQAIGGTTTVPQGQVALTYCASLGSGNSTQSTGNPPTVTPSTPANNASYSYSSGSPASVPVSFTAVSPSGSGNITGVSATLNGQAISLSSVTGVNSSATATASATLSLTQAGTYTLLYTGTNAYGSDTETVTFTVVQATPPTITISTPQAAAQYTITSGSTASVPYSFTGGTNYGTITAVTATLGSSTLSPSVSGLNSTSISGSGTLTLAAGTYTLTATDTNSAGSGTASVTFSVVSGQTGCGSGSSTGSEVLTWLQCNSFNSSYSCSQNNNSKVTVTGGSVVPVTFTLNGSSHSWSDNWNGCWDNTCNSSNFISDQTVVISISEVFANGTSSTPVIYTYGASGPNPPYYSIGNNQYVLYFPTASGSHHYEVQVYHPVSTSNLQLLGSQDVYTQANCLPSSGSCSTGFNNSTIYSGRTIWFNSCVNVTGLSGQECTLWFDTSTINFTVSRTACSIAAPAGCIKFDPNCTSATTTYNAIANCWVTTVPVGYTGNVFLTGVCYQAPSSISGGLSPVTWNGVFRGDNGNCNARWQWAAAVYTQAPSNPNSLGVKPCDSSSLSQYRNGDNAGTPESYKYYVTSGACGSGGSNCTGSYTSSIAPSVGTNYWMSSSVGSSGWGNDSNNGWNWGW